MKREFLTRYLSLLGVAEGPPSLVRLRQLVRAHLERVPFENVSKLYALRTRGLRGVPELEAYLDGIERYHFGGTCYSNNPYLAELLFGARGLPRRRRAGHTGDAGESPERVSRRPR